ncbi:hypothetical protein JKP88DRAFT_149899, partial [Tribonema minus]
MELPPSSLLGKLEAFLPKLAQANRDLQQQTLEGQAETIDAHLALDAADGNDEESESSDGEGDVAVAGASARAINEGAGDMQGGGKVVQLSFALGDFDDTPVAQFEE